MVEGGNKDIVSHRTRASNQPARRVPGQTSIHLGLGESHITRHVFDCYAASEKILDPPDPAGDMVECFGGVRDRQKVMKIDPMHPSPAEMVGDPFRRSCVNSSSP